MHKHRSYVFLTLTHQYDIVSQCWVNIWGHLSNFFTSNESLLHAKWKTVWEPSENYYLEWFDSSFVTSSTRNVQIVSWCILDQKLGILNYHKWDPVTFPQSQFTCMFENFILKIMLWFPKRQWVTWISCRVLRLMTNLAEVLRKVLAPND